MNLYSEEIQDTIKLEQGEQKATQFAKGELRWYAVQVASGCEKRVKTNLTQRIQTLDVTEKIFKMQF